MTTVLLADDHQLLRQALRRALEDAGFEVIAEAADGGDAVRLTEKFRPQVVVMDVSMPVLDGLEATRRIHALRPDLPVVVLTMHGDDHVKSEALAAGAVGFLSKDCSMQEVVEAVREVATSDTALSAEVAGAMLEALSGPPGTPPDDPASAADSPLTPRETEILQLIADGRSTTDVARELFISPKTVKNHLAAIYAKLDARDRTQAVVTGVRIGIVKLG
jgi:DNA-binding NarL/FixJ family response regulator